ncbi:hypothetical protein JCM11491_002685 [Sporobolomyces phaffii]
MLQEYSPATAALREATTGTRAGHYGSKSPALRQTQSAFDLSPRSAPTIPPSTGFFRWARWYRDVESEKLDADDSKEALDDTVSDEVTNLFKEAFRRRKELIGPDVAGPQGGEQTSFDETDTFAWPDSISGGGAHLDSNRSSLASSLNNTGTLPSLDLDDFPASFDYSPPRTRRSPPRRSADSSGPAPSYLRSTQSNVTLKAPQILRRVSSSASILSTSVEVPPQGPHSPGSVPPSPTASSDEFTLSPTLLSFSTTSSLDSDSTSRSSSTLTSATSAASSACSSSTSASARSDSSFRSRISTLRKAASSAALKFFVAKDEGPPPPLPATASVLLRDVLLKHDQTHPDSPSPPLPSHPFYYPSHAGRHPRQQQRPSSASSTTWAHPATGDYHHHSSGYDDADDDSPSSAFPPFDPFTTFEPRTSPSKNCFPPGAPLGASPEDAAAAAAPNQPRVLARQRSFIDPTTRALRTAPSLLCTPPTPDKTDRARATGFGGADEDEHGSAGSDDSGRNCRTEGEPGGAGGGGDRAASGMRSRRKRGKRKTKSARNLRRDDQPPQ